MPSSGPLVVLQYDDDPPFARGKKQPYVEVRAVELAADGSPREGEPMGYARFRLGRQYLYSHEVYVRHEFRRQGLASTLYTAAEERWDRTIRHAKVADRTRAGRAFVRGRHS